MVTRQRLQATPITTPPRSSTQHSLNKPLPSHHPVQYRRDPVNSVSVNGIPIRSPPKPTIKRGSNDFHHGRGQGERGQTVLPVATDSTRGIPRRSYNHSPMYHYTPTIRTRSVKC